MRLARGVHAALYGLMLVVPLTGWIASAATGIDILLWNQITLPRVVPVSEAWENGFFLAHKILTRLLMALLVVHVAGLVFRIVVKRDRTLARMIRG